MHLPERGGGDRGAVEPLERLRQPDADLVLDDPFDLFVWERRDAVLQSRQRLEVREREQIAARRQQLPELDEGRTERFEIAGECLRIGGIRLECGWIDSLGSDEIRVPILCREPRQVAVPAETLTQSHRPPNSASARSG